MRLSCQLLERHGLVKESLQLLLVSGLGARGRGGGAVPADVLEQPVVAAHSGLSPGLDVRPGAHVLVLLLHPVQLRVTVQVSHHLHQVEGEGADLLDSVDGNLTLEPFVLPLLYEVVVHLASAEQNFGHFRRRGRGWSRIEYHPLEL